MRQIVFIPDGLGGYVIEVPSLPGCRAGGKNATQAITNVKQAIYAYIDHLIANGHPVPEATIIDIPKAEGVIQTQLLLKEDVVEAVQTAFPNEVFQTVLDVLNEYGTQLYELDRERVQIAVIRLSGGNLDRLLELITQAKQDYRDILVAYTTKFGENI
jgi:predicted RNase H-like HicB family nuclease